MDVPTPSISKKKKKKKNVFLLSGIGPKPTTHDPAEGFVTFVDSKRRREELLLVSN